MNNNDEPTEVKVWTEKIWKNSEGQIHRDGDKPAVIWPDGHCEWRQNGQLHRDNDLPAVIERDGWCGLYQNGKYIKAKWFSPKEVEELKKPYRGKENE